jgi:acyl-CoA thioesterase FadM
VEIVTSLTRVNYRALTFGYEMRLVAADGDGGKPRKIATGHTSHIFLNREMRPTTLPQQFWGMFGIPERQA